MSDMDKLLYIPEDCEFVAGRSPEKAQELLDLAAAADLPYSVSTTYDGYIVPKIIFGSKNAEPIKDTAPAQEQAPAPAQEPAPAPAETPAPEAPAETPAPETETPAPVVEGFDPLTAPIEDVNAVLVEDAGTTKKGASAPADAPATPEGEK